MADPRVLILGADGMLGHELVRVLGSRLEIAATVRTSAQTGAVTVLADRMILRPGVDATAPETVADAVRDVRPDVVVNCIGIVKQRREASDPVASIRVNSLFPHQLALVCAEHRCRLVHVSTDCVFSGRRGGYAEDDLADPVDLYGRSKLLGEPVGERCLTLRTSMIGPELKGASGLLEWFLAQRGGRVTGFTRAIFSGLTTTALSRIIERIVAEHPGLSGLYHLASDPISKHDLLVRIRDRLELDVEIRPAADPRCDRSLDGRRFATATGIAPPSWDSMMEGLARDLRARERA